MGEALVVVESPAKAKTIKKYLGAGYVVKASVGHVKDLPKKKMGIDIEHGFQPEYVVIETRRRSSPRSRKRPRTSSKIYLATDPDREGEAIAWHIAEEIRPSNPNIQRVLFHEITKKGINEAILRPTTLDMKKFDAQQARRVLDRIVGYEISPVLWTKVRRGLSAGRVQSVAVRLIVEREREIKAFVPEEYWTVEVQVEGGDAAAVHGQVHAARRQEDRARRTRARRARWSTSSSRRRSSSAAVERKERRKNAPAPFITTKLQQEASSKLRFSPKRTMGLAQRLYEGVELGEDGLVGLITYMRTDSTRLSDDAVTEVRAYIGERFGADRLPAEPNVYKTKKDAQDAHEAIRPTSTKYDPETVRKLWAAGQGGGRDERETDDLLRLYTLIWNRTIACQMVPAVFDQTRIEIGAGRVELRATGQVMKFAGFLEVYAETVEDAANEDETSGALPEVQARARRSSCSRRGPSSTSRSRRRASPRRRSSRSSRRRASAGRRPTPRSSRRSRTAATSRRRRGASTRPSSALMVDGLLLKSFPDIVSSDFTAQMEAQLDKVEEGEADWVKLLKDFYTPFKVEVETAKKEMRNVKAEEKATDEVCEKCGKPMVIKWGRNGHFLACSGYPECRNTKEYVKNVDGTLTIVPTTRPSDMKCPTCGAGHGHQARPLRRVPGVHEVPRVQDDGAHVARRDVPQAGLRRLPHREALEARQGVLRLLELPDDAVRLRLVGPAGPAAVPEVRREVPAAEGLEDRHAPLLQRQGRLRLHGRRGRGRRGDRAAPEAAAATRAARRPRTRRSASDATATASAAAR